MGRIEIILEKFEPKEENESELLNIEEAAEFLKVSVAAIYTKVSRQEIPFSKPGKRLYFNRSELKEWVRLGKRQTINEIIKTADILPYRHRTRPALRRAHVKI